MANSYLFRPHWRHKGCGGIVCGQDEVFKCLQCDQTGASVGAVLPTEENTDEYFASHPELEVELLAATQAAAASATVNDLSKLSTALHHFNALYARILQSKDRR